MARKSVFLKDVRLSYPNLFKKSAFGDDDSKLSYSAMFVFEKGSDTHKEVLATLKGLLKEEFGDEAKSVWEKLTRQNRTIIHDGEEMEGKAGFSDEVAYLAAYNYEVRPLVVDRKRNPIAEEDGIIYPGCYGNASIQFYTWKNQKGKGLGCELKGFQFVRDGERLGGATPASVDDFPDLDEEEDAGSDWDAPARSTKSGKKPVDEDDWGDEPKATKSKASDDDWDF